MKIINTLVFVLIAGILSSTNTQAYRTEEKGLLLEIIKISYSPGISKINISQSKDGRVKAVDELLKESCSKYGAPDSYDTAKSGWQYFINCDETEPNSIKNTKENITAEENLIFTLKSTCATAPTQKECMKRFKESIEPCLNPEERESIKIMDNLINSLLQFICDDNGARITKFTEDGGVKCFHSKRPALLGCVSEFTSNYDLAKNFDWNSPAGGLSLLTSVPEVKDCINIDKFQQCNFKALSNCEHHTPADITDAFFNSVKQGIDCEKLYKSHASVSSVANFVLISILLISVWHFE